MTCFRGSVLQELPLKHASRVGSFVFRVLLLGSCLEVAVVELPVSREWVYTTALDAVATRRRPLALAIQPRFEEGQNS